MVVFALKIKEKKNDERSWNIVYMESGCELNIFTQNEVNPPKDLGGAREQTNKQTGYQYYNIDSNNNNNTKMNK